MTLAGCWNRNDLQRAIERIEVRKVESGTSLESDEGRRCAPWNCGSEGSLSVHHALGITNLDALNHIQHRIRLDPNHPNHPKLT